MTHNFLMAGGGTGGHVIPGLAVARELRARGHQVCFVGTEHGMEGKLVPAAGFDLQTIQIGGLNGVGLRRTISTLGRLPIATVSSNRCVRTADAVFSMGGYVAGPPVIAAILNRVPVVVMEPNAVPGFTNRSISRLVARALVAFPETADFFPRGRTEVIGLPVREEFFQIQPKAPGDVLHLLITGGSQGARTLNHAAMQSWPFFREAGFPIRITHQTGTAGFDEIHDAFAKSGIEGEVVRFISDMPAAFADADLVICRSGAGAVSELAASGKPSILVPFPYASDNHQTRNAQAMERGGASRLIRDAEMTGKMMFETISQLTANLAAMGEAARQFAKPGAARRAADVLEEVATA